VNKTKTQRMVGIAIFTAIVVVLQLLGAFIRVGGFNISLVLIPIVVGAAVYGPGAGAFLGGVFGLVVTIACITGSDPSGALLFGVNPFLTIVTCMGKGILAGLAAGAVYRAIAKPQKVETNGAVYTATSVKRRVLAVIAAAVVCPVVNTGIFCLALILFFKEVLTSWAGGTDLIYYVFIGLIGVNFLIELGINVVLSPIITRIIDISKKAK
jgi:uncharacterized membrane protein